jgi:hypothetical protein
MAVIAGATLNGTMALELSVNGEDWEEMADSEQALPASGGNLYWEITTGAPYIRGTVTTADANAATVNFSVFGKR